MNLIGNLIFLVFGGFIIFLGYVLGGEVREKEPPGGALSIILNIIWIILPGLELAIMHLVLAAFFALTIIGIPIAAQHIKLLPLALLPFGREMRDIETGRTYP